MDQRTQPKSIAGPLLLMFVLLADVGLGVWAWHLYQTKQAKYDSDGLALSSPPPAARVETPAVAQPKPPMADPSNNIIKSPIDAGKPPAARRDPAGTPGAQESAKARAETRQLVARAAYVYFDLKKNRRFKQSAVIQGWKRDFLSFPDLKALDEQYRRDRDGVRFLVQMGRSPNFRPLLQKYFQSDDIKAFIEEMRVHPVVVSAAQNFLKDYNLEAAVKHLLPAAAASPAPQAAQPRPTGAPSADALKRLKSNPALKRYIEQ